MGGNDVAQPVTLKEILGILKAFPKDKSPSPDDWTVNFFLHFFDMIGSKLVNVVNESRLNSKVVGALNSTFIAIIPKGDQQKTLNDYI